MRTRWMLTAAAVLLGAGAAMAGPPIMCHPLMIDKAESLPLGSGAFDTQPGYTGKKVVEAAMGLLKTERDALVRMETLRRATAYLSKDRASALDLMSRLQAIALEQEAADRKDAQAWFDVGFLAACYAQMDVDWGHKAGVENGVVGYAYVKRALALAPNDPALQFGAALVTHPAMGRGTQPIYDGHVKLAAAGAKPGTLLEKNLTAHLNTWGTSLEKVRQSQGARADADGRR